MSRTIKVAIIVVALAGVCFGLYWNLFVFLKKGWDAEDLFGSGRTKDLEGHSAPHFQTAAVTLKHAGFLSNEWGEAQVGRADGIKH
jgi:hypothetical protein